jgi:hypothetical protein
MAANSRVRTSCRVYGSAHLLRSDNKRTFFFSTPQPAGRRNHCSGSGLYGRNHNVIRWDRELSSIQLQDAGRYELVFRNGTSEKVDLVGAARIRPANAASSAALHCS